MSDGTIVAVSDEWQDQIPGSNPPAGSLTVDQYGGNDVVQRFEQDGQTYYALHAHLKPGTAKARVSVGQTVRAGDLVGELGNSGNTDAPHLHFHVMDGPDPLASDSILTGSTLCSLSAKRAAIPPSTPCWTANRLG